MRIPSPSRARSATSALAASFVLGALGGLAGCAGTPVPLEPIDPAFQPAFDALTAAVDAHDDELAQHILARVLARNPDQATRRRAEAFDRILRGRALAERLDFALSAEPGESPTEVRLVLEARHDLPELVRLRTAHALVKYLVTGVDPAGLEQRAGRTQGAPAAADLNLPAGETVRVALGRFPLQAGAALAVRGRWELDLMAGEIAYAGEWLPANEVTVAPHSEVRLAEFLPDGAVEPAELVRYLEGERFSTAAMLERAVRIDPARRGEALDLLTPLVVGGTAADVERAVPALRWLSGRRDLGGDPATWRRWFSARAEGREDDPQPKLSLPQTVAL